MSRPARPAPSFAYPTLGCPRTSPSRQMARPSQSNILTRSRSGTCRRALLGSAATSNMSTPVFSPDGSRIVGLPYRRERDGTVLIVDVPMNLHPLPLEGAPVKARATAFSADGKLLAASGEGMPATVWDASSGRKLAQSSGKTGNATRLLFTRDGQSVIFTCEDGRVRSWHFAERAEPIASLAGHTKEVWALAYTPDGSMLISASDDHTIKLWNARGGSLLATLKGHDCARHIPCRQPRRPAARQWGLRQDSPNLGPTRRPSPRRAPRTHGSGSLPWPSRPGQDHRLGRLRRHGPDLGRGQWCTAPSHSRAHRHRVHPGLPTRRHAARHGERRSDHTRMGHRQRSESFSLSCPRHCSTLSFSPDGNWLASGDDWGSVSIWDVGTGSRRTSVKGSGLRSGTSPSHLMGGLLPPRAATRRSVCSTRSRDRSHWSSMGTPSASTPWPSPPTAGPSPPRATTARSNSGTRGRSEAARCKVRDSRIRRRGPGFDGE